MRSIVTGGAGFIGSHLVDHLVPIESIGSAFSVGGAHERHVRVWRDEPAFVLEKTMSARVFASEDAREGPRAFAAKCKPEYTGR